MHILSNIALSWFSLFMADNLFSSKQRPFVLPLPDHRDHWEAKGGGWYTGSGGLSVAQAREWQKASPWAKGKGSRGGEGGGRTGWASPPLAATAATLDLSHRNSPRRKTPGPSLLRGGEHREWHQAGAEATLSGGESQGVPREMGGSPYSKPQWNKRQADSGLGRGAGRLGVPASPLLAWKGSSQHPHSPAGLLHPRRNAPQWGSGVSVSLGPWNLQLTQGGPRPPQVGHSWVGRDTEHPSSPGRGAGRQGTPPLIAGIPERYLPGLCSQLLLQIKSY